MPRNRNKKVNPSKKSYPKTQQNSKQPEENIEDIIDLHTKANRNKLIKHAKERYAAGKFDMSIEEFVSMVMDDTDRLITEGYNIISKNNPDFVTELDEKIYKLVSYASFLDGTKGMQAGFERGINTANNMLKSNGYKAQIVFNEDDENQIILLGDKNHATSNEYNTPLFYQPEVSFAAHVASSIVSLIENNKKFVGWMIFPLIAGAVLWLSGFNFTTLWIYGCSIWV